MVKEIIVISDSAWNGVVNLSLTSHLTFLKKKKYERIGAEEHNKEKLVLTAFLFFFVHN